MSDYSEDIADAREMIAEAGGLGSIEIPAGTANADKPWRVDDAPSVSYPVNLVIFETENPPQAYVATADLLGVAPAGFEVLSGMLLNDPSGRKWSIDKVNTLRPNGTDAIFAICFVSRMVTAR